MDSRSLPVVRFAVVLLLYGVLVAGNISTVSPMDDEGMFADPAQSLLTRGVMGTRTMDEAGLPWQNGNLHTYYMPPLHYVMLSGWFGIVGFGLFTMRALSAVLGVGYLVAWFMVLQRVGLKRWFWILLLLAADPVVVGAASRGRMDMSCAALGMAALATYMSLRESNLRAAVFGSCCFVVLSGLSHPFGILYAVDLLGLSIWRDRKRWSWGLAGIAVVPFVVGALGWGMYIMQDPTDFVRQFSANFHSQGRLLSPLGSLKMEPIRYAATFGFLNSSRFKLIFLLVTVICAAVWLGERRWRREMPLAILAVCGSANVVLLALLDGHKVGYYLIHTMPFILAGVGAVLVWMMHRDRLKWPAVAALMLYLGVQIAVTGGRVRKNDYKNDYLPTARFVRRHISPETRLVFAPYRFGFELGFGPPVVNDTRLGFLSGKQPDLFVTTDDGKEGDMDGRPEQYERYRARLLQGYCKADTGTSMQVYLPKGTCPEKP